MSSRILLNLAWHQRRERRKSRLLALQPKDLKDILYYDEISLQILERSGYDI